MSVLVLVEHDGSYVKDATLATVTAAATSLGDVHALVLGSPTAPRRCVLLVSPKVDVANDRRLSTSCRAGHCVATKALLAPGTPPTWKKYRAARRGLLDATGGQ